MKLIQNLKLKNCLLTLVLLSFSCDQINYLNIPLRSKTGNIQAVIEIPAGTNHKIEYNKEHLDFQNDIRGGEKRVIDYLPYLGNYGFIPSTYSTPEKGGDADPLDVLILCERLETKTVIEILPIGLLKLIDNGELDYKVIALPYDKDLKIIKTETFVDFETKYNKVKEIIEYWFLNYDKEEPTTLIGWGDELDALAEIQKWEISK